MKHELEHSWSSLHLLQPRTCKGGDSFHLRDYYTPRGDLASPMGKVGSALLENLQDPLPSPGAKPHQGLVECKTGSEIGAVFFDNSGASSLRSSPSAMQ